MDIGAGFYVEGWCLQLLWTFKYRSLCGYVIGSLGWTPKNKIVGSHG